MRKDKSPAISLIHLQVFIRKNCLSTTSTSVQRTHETFTEFKICVESLLLFFKDEIEIRTMHFHEMDIESVFKKFITRKKVANEPGERVIFFLTDFFILLLKCFKFCSGEFFGCMH